MLNRMIYSIILFIACTLAVKLSVIKKKNTNKYSDISQIERTTIHSYDTRRSGANNGYYIIQLSHTRMI